MTSLNQAPNQAFLQDGMCHRVCDTRVVFLSSTMKPYELDHIYIGSLNRFRHKKFIFLQQVRLNFHWQGLHHKRFLIYQTQNERLPRRSITFIKGILPHDIGIDAFPIEDKPPSQRHAYITWARLLKHDFTRGCSGCAKGHNKHSDECKARFDAIFSKLVRLLDQHRNQLLMGRRPKLSHL